jgi:uncharacterized membrane protein YdjX (TVP38/TMEM64 family)
MKLMESDMVKAGAERAPARSASWLARHGQKLAALCFWLLVIGGYQWYAWRTGLTPLAAMRELIGFLSSNAFGPLIFIAIYTLRPLVLFSATVLTLGAGFLYGPLLGIVYTVIGSNLSATVAYLVGRFFGNDVMKRESSGGIVASYADRLRHNSFETVLTMRFIFLPYDLVNYLAGFLRIDYKAFILATILGSIPGTIAFVLAGASFEGDLTGMPAFDWRVFAASAAIFVISIVISRVVRRRERGTAAYNAN